jgi:hypothetical protein
MMEMRETINGPLKLLVAIAAITMNDYMCNYPIDYLFCKT